MTGFAGPLHILAPYTDVTGASIDESGNATLNSIAVAGAVVSGTAQATSFLFQGIKNVSFAVTALTSGQSTALALTKQPYVLLIMTVGGTSVAFAGYPAGTLAG